MKNILKYLTVGICYIPSLFATQEWPTRPDLLIDCHIHKTGGTTILPVLARFGDISTSGAVCVARYIHKNSYELLDSRYLDLYDIRSFLRHYLQINKAQRSKIKVLLGHLSPGAADFFASHGVNARCFSLIRDPFKRYVSHFNFVYYIQPDAIKNTEEELDIFYHFLNEENNINYQTVWIASHINGDEKRFDEKKRFARSTLQSAIDRVKKSYLFLGVTERMDECMVLFSKMTAMPLEACLYPEIPNTTSYLTKYRYLKRARLEDLPYDIKTCFYERNQLDIELYEWANKQMDVLIEEYDLRYGEGSFERDLTMFRSLRSAYPTRWSTEEWLCPCGRCY